MLFIFMCIQVNGIHFCIKYHAFTGTPRSLNKIITLFSFFGSIRIWRMKINARLFLSFRFFACFFIHHFVLRYSASWWLWLVLGHNDITRKKKDTRRWKRITIITISWNIIIAACLPLDVSFCIIVGFFAVSSGKPAFGLWLDVCINNIWSI